MEQRMKYCIHCGKEILEAAIICPHCGCAVASKANMYADTEDIPSTALNILGFLLPIVGLILFLVYQETKPNKAKAIGKFSLIGFIVGVVFYVFSSCMMFY